MTQVRGPVVDIVVRSYFRDLRWLEHCLHAIERHASGFRHVLVVAPAASRERLERANLRGARPVSCPDYEDDYLGQQVTKLHADELTDADFICHVDSDCLFRRPVHASEMFREGRPELWITRWASLPGHAPWRRVTELFLKRPLAYDYMRRPPFVYPRQLYAAIRRHALLLHGVPLREYVLAQPPRGFSEFNALGAFAHVFQPDAFSWREVPSDAPTQSYCRWYWSWGGITAEIEAEIEGLLDDSPITPR